MIYIVNLAMLIIHYIHLRLKGLQGLKMKFLMSQFRKNSLNEIAGVSVVKITDYSLERMDCLKQMF